MRTLLVEISTDSACLRKSTGVAVECFKLQDLFIAILAGFMGVRDIDENMRLKYALSSIRFHYFLQPKGVSHE